MKTLIANVQIILENEIATPRNIVVDGGRICQIEDERNCQGAYDQVIDGRGMYLAPGFIDIHAHGNTGHDIMDMDTFGFEAIAAYQLSRGVTSFLATTLSTSTERLLECTRIIANYVKSQKDDVSEMLGVYLEGPYFSPMKAGAQPKEWLRIPDIAELNKLIEVKKGLIKVVSLAPELVGSNEVIRLLTSQNIVVAMGHTMADYATAQAAIANGVTIATHLFNAMKPFDHREPGVIGAALVDDRVFVELIADGAHLHDATIRLAVKAKGTDRILLISDQIRAAGLEDGTYTLDMEAVCVKNGVVRSRTGALAGSTFDLAKAVQRMVFDFGYSLFEAVKMATINPAIAIGVDNEIGSIAIGKQADLVFLDEHLEITHVMKRGLLIK